MKFSVMVYFSYGNGVIKSRRDPRRTITFSRSFRRKVTAAAVKGKLHSSLSTLHSVYVFGGNIMLPYLALLLSAVLVLVDQLTKIAVQHWLKPIGDFPLIDGVLHLTYLENRGMAFGMMQGQKWLLIWVTAIVLLVLIAAVMMGKVKKPATLFTVAVIIGGGVGNLIDRIYRGYVIDFIYVKIINFAIFNFADICAVCGAGLLLVSVIVDEVREHKRKKSAVTDETEENGDSPKDNE